MKKIIIFVVITSLFFCVCGCSNTKDKQNKKNIAVSIVPEATFVSAVADDNFNIITMIPAGANPETYELTTKEIEKFSRAELYFSIGVPSEENSILPVLNSATKNVELHETVAATYPELLIDGERDPHIWLSPKRAIIMVEKIADELSVLDQKNASVYKTNAEKFINELKKLDQEIKTILSNCQSKNFIAYHPAFAYFADEYGLKMHAIEHHGKEATAKDMADMIKLAKKENIKTVFYQAETSGRQAKAFAQEIGGEAVSLEPLSASYIENLKTMAQKIAGALN